MYFIHIASLADADDFTSWLDGQNRVAFNDSEEFFEWLAGRSVFPLEIYINGMTLRFDTPEQLRFFRLGIETMLTLNDFYD